MEWIPAVFVVFKLLVLGTGMYYAIKWHYDQGKKDKEQGKERRTVLRAACLVAAIFVVLLVGLGVATFVLARMLGMDMNL